MTKTTKVLAGVVLSVVALGSVIAYSEIQRYRARRQVDADRREAERADAMESIFRVRGEAMKYAEAVERGAQDAVAECDKYSLVLMTLLPSQGMLIKPPPPRELAEQVASDYGVSSVSGVKVARAVLEMRDLWGVVYGGQVLAVRVRAEVDQIVEACSQAQAGESAGVASLSETARAVRAARRARGRAKAREMSLEALQELADRVQGQLDKLLSGRDTAKVVAVLNQVRNRAPIIVRICTEDAKDSSLAARAEQQLAEREQADAEARGKRLEDRRVRSAREVEEARRRFNALVSRGYFKALDWTGAQRQMDLLRSEFKTIEGDQAIQQEKARIEAMRTLHASLVANAKGYVFTQGAQQVAARKRQTNIDRLSVASPTGSARKGGTLRSIAGCKVVSTSDTGLVLSRPDRTTTTSVAWRNFYAYLYVNVVELVEAFVVKARETSVMGDDEWVERMAGAVLLMRVLYADLGNAEAQAEAWVSEVVRQVPEASERLDALVSEGEASGE